MRGPFSYHFPADTSYSCDASFPFPFLPPFGHKVSSKRDLLFSVHKRRKKRKKNASEAEFFHSDCEKKTREEREELERPSWLSSR